MKRKLTLSVFRTYLGECGFLFKVHSTLHTENKKTRNYGVNKGGWGWGRCQHRWVGMGWTSTWVGGGGVDVYIEHHM